MTAALPNPAWDDAVRWRIQHALDQVCRIAQDVLRRHTEDGRYVAPSVVAEGGDVSGLMGSGRLEVLDRLASVVASANVEFAKVAEEIDAFQRARFGKAWQPVTAARPATEETP